MRSTWFVVLLCSLLAGALGLHVATHAGDVSALVADVDIEVEVEDLEEDLEDDLADDAEHWLPHRPPAATWSMQRVVASFALTTSAADGWRSRPTRPPTA